jgi:hypothetical protein
MSKDISVKVALGLLRCLTDLSLGYRAFSCIFENSRIQKARKPALSGGG